MRGYANLVEPASVLIMDGPGRLVLARPNRDRAGSGWERAPDTEANVVVHGCRWCSWLRLAVRRFLGLLLQEPPRTTRRQRAAQASGVGRGSYRPPGRSHGEGAKRYAATLASKSSCPRAN